MFYYIIVTLYILTILPYRLYCPISITTIIISISYIYLIMISININIICTLQSTPSII